MPHPRRRSPESFRRRRREKRLSREDPAGLYSSSSPKSSIAPQQTAGSYSADSPRIQQQQPYDYPSQQDKPQPQPQLYSQSQLPSQPLPQFQPPEQQPRFQPPPLHHQQTASSPYPSPQQYQQQYPASFPHQTSLPPMSQRQTPSQDVLPRSRASSGSLSSSLSSSSSSYTEISRQYPTSRFGGFFSTFIKAPSEVRRRQRRRGSGTKRRRGVFFGGGSNSSHSSINSDMAYGTGFVKKEKDRSTRYSSSVAGSAASSSHPQQQLPYSQYPAALPNRPSPRLSNEAKRNKTDEEIIAIGRQLSDLARRSNEEDLRHAGKTRPSGLASTAAAISALRKSRKEAKKRGIAGSKKHRDSSSDESDWESASDDDDSSSGSSSSDDSLMHLAYGGEDSSRSNVALSGSDTHLAYGGDSSLSNVALPVSMGTAAGAVATSVDNSNPSHSRKSSVVDPRLFGPLNSLRGLVNTPCGFGDETRPPPATGSGSGPHLYDNDRPATGGSQADSARRPAPVPLQQPIPKAPVSNKVFEAGRRDSRNSYRRQQSNSGILDPTLGGGVAAAAAAAAARMADQRGPWSEDRIYRDDVKLARPDPDEDHFQRDQAPFEELERRRANPEVYYNRRDDDVDSPRMESNREMPDYYGKDSPGPARDGRTWMELHPEERKESLKYQTTYDAHMREIETRQAQERRDRLRNAQRQQQQQQQPQHTARATKAGDRNADKPAQPAPKPNVDPFQYQVADDAFGTPQFNNTPRRPLTPEIVTVDRVPNFTESRSVTASAPSPAPSMQVRPPRADIRLSRKDSHELEKAAEERQRGGIYAEFRGRDPRAGFEYEQEEREARSILDEAKHSTIPVAAVAIASAIAVEEERSRERKRREYSEDGSRDRSRPQKDAVQEDADRYYRESVIARKIASDEIRSRSKSPEESVVDKWENPAAKESFAIVSPPSMEDREHDDDENPYAPPNADVKVDNEIFPHETDRFRATNGVDASRFRARDASRERPLLNIVRPTPVPSPDPTSGADEALKQPADVPASQELSNDLADSSEDEESDHKEAAAHSSPTGKSVSWGENSTKRFVVESPEARSRAESPNEPAEAEEKPRPRLSKISQWGKIAAMMAAGTAEPTTELDRHTAKRSGDVPSDDNVDGAPPVPGPKPVSPEPEQVPGTYADDLEFAATVAAGLKESGFDPNIVIDDPAFRRRDSRPGTNETPVMGHVAPEQPVEEPVSVPAKDDARRDEPQVHLTRSRGQEDEAELSLTDTEDEEDEKSQKQEKLDRLEKYLQMRRSGEIKPPSPLQEESVEPPTTQARPVTPPPRGNERRNILENLLQKRQSGEIQPPREVLEAVESRNSEPVPEIQDEGEDKKAKMEKLEKFLQTRQSGQTKEPETTEPLTRRNSDIEQPPAEPIEPEALAEADDSASDVAPADRPKKRKTKKRRDRLDEASTISSRLDDDQSRLSIPGDEGTELSRASVPGDEASDIRTVFSVEDWEDWDSSPRSTRKSLVASELSTSSRRSMRGKRRSATERDIREGRDEHDERGARPESRDDERKPRNREARHYQDDDENSEKPVPPRQRKDSGKKSNFFSGIFKSGNKNDKSSINEKGESFFEQAGTLGAGAGLASIAAAAAKALTRSNAADVSSDPENISRDLPGSSREDEEDHYPVIAPRAIAIDPQYGDLLPLPPSLPGTPTEASFDELPGLPDSRPGTPVEDRSRRFEKSHRRQRSNQENNLSNSRNRSHSNTAVPLALLRGVGSTSPSSPVRTRTPRTPPRPTSWDSTKEFMPLMLLEHARRGSNDRSPKGGDLPPLPPSEATSEAEGGAMSDPEEHEEGKLLPVLRPEDFRSPMPPNDGFNLADRSLRLQTQIPAMEHAVTDEESQDSTPKADVAYELPVQPTDNTLGEAAAGHDYRLPGPRTAGNDRAFSTGNDDEPVPVDSTPSSGHSAKTVDAQAVPGPPTPTRRFLSPRQDIVRHHSDGLTSPDERSDAFETARTSPAAMPDDDQYEPDLPPIEPSMLGAIPEFSRPAKFFEDKVPDHPELASMDRVIETLPSIESVPKDQARTDALRNSAERSSDESKEKGDWKGSKSISPGAEFDRDFSAQPMADETSAAFVGIPESAIDKDRTLDTEYISSTEPFSKEVLPHQALEPARDKPEEHTWAKESRAQPVMVEDELESEREPEAERYAPGPELEWKSEPVALFEPLDEVPEAPSNEAFVDIVPVSDEASSDVIAKSSQRSVPEEVEEEIVIGTLPAATRKITGAALEPILENTTAAKDFEPIRHDAGGSREEYSRKAELSTAVEDSEESEEEDDSEDEDDDSEDSEGSEESEEEEEERARHIVVAGVVKRDGEEEHAVRDMTASIETLGAGSVVSTSSKKSKKKKKKKKKRKRKKKKSKSAAAAGAAAEASHDTPLQHTTESTEQTGLPVVEATKPASDVAVALPAELEKTEGAALAESAQPPPGDAVEVVEGTPVDLPKDTTTPEPSPEASEQPTRHIEEEALGEKAQDAVISPEPTPHEGLGPAPEHTILADTEEPLSVPPTTIEETNNEEPGVDDELQKWAATDSEPIPRADRIGDGKTEVISSELCDEQEGEKRSFQVEDEAIDTEEQSEVPAPLPEELAFQEESPLQQDTAPTTGEPPANIPAELEDRDSPVQDRGSLVTDEALPAAEELPIESPAVIEEPVEQSKGSPASDTREQSFVASEASADDQWTVREDERRDSQETVTGPEYEETIQLPTIMEEPALEDAIASEVENFVPSEVDQHAPIHNDQLSPILEELMEDLLDEAAPVEKSEGTTEQDGETKPGPAADDSAWSIGHSEDQFEHQGSEEARILEPIAEEPEDDSLEPTPNEGAPRTIEEIADRKDTDWAPNELPSFASEVSEPLFSQGDSPSEYPTQQYPDSAELTQMGESFAVPEEPLRPPPPVPTAAVDEADPKATKLEVPASVKPPVDAHSEYPTQQYHDHAGPTQTEESFPVPEEPLRPPPPVPNAADGTTEVESAAPREPAVDASPEYPTVESTQLDESFAVPEEPVRPPPPVPNAAESNPEASDLELLAPMGPIVDSPAQEQSERFEAAPSAADNAPSAEERGQNDERLSTPAPEASLQEPELNEVVSLEEGDKDGRNASPAEEDFNIHDGAAVEHPSSTELDQDGVPREHHTAPDSSPSEQRGDDNEAKRDESKHLPESESVPPQETSRELDLEPKAEDDELKPTTDDTDLKTEDSEEKSRDAQVDATESDAHLETEPSVELPPTHEMELAPEKENNANVTLDTKKADEKAEAPGQSAALDSADDLKPAVDTSHPQEPDMTPELDQSTAQEAEVVASPAIPADADEKVELERSIQPEDPDRMDLAQDDTAAPVSAVPQDPSEDVERADEAKDASPEVDELRTDDALVPQEAQIPMETELVEPANEAQKSAVAGDQNEVKAPADSVKDDLTNTTLPTSDPVADDGSHLDNHAVDEARSEPADAPENVVPDSALEDTPIAVGRPEEAPLQQASDQPQQGQRPDEPKEEVKSDEPEPEVVAEEAGKELETGLDETQVGPTPEESRRESTSETQEEPVLEEPKPEEPHLEEAVAEQKDEAQYPSTAEESLEPDVQDKEAEASGENCTDAPTSDTAQTEAQPAELGTAPEPHAMEPAHDDKPDEPSMPETAVIAESAVPVESAAAEPEQMPLSEAVSVPTEEPRSTERADQREPESALPTETPAEASQELTDKPQESNSVRSSSMHLTVPGQEEDSGSEYGSDDSYDASSVASDMSYQRDFTRSGSLGPNDSTTRITGFEVVATPRVEGHAHRDRHRKKKKKKKGKSKHKRKKSRGGSDPSSSLTSLSESVPTTSNPSLGGSVPSLSVEPPVDEPQVPGQLEAGSRATEGQDSGPVPAVSDGTVTQPSTEDDLFSKYADEPELSPSEQEKPTERAAAASPDLETILEEVAGEEPQPKESTKSPDNEAAEISRPPEPVNEPEPNDREAPATEAPQESTASAPLEDDSETKWDMFTGSWGNSGRKSESGLLESPEITRSSRKIPDDVDGSSMHIIQDAPLVEEPSEISTPQRMSADIPERSQLRSEKRASSVPGSQSPKKGSRPASQGGEKSDRWFGSLSGGISLFSERFGSPRKKKAKDRDKDPIGEDDKEDPKEESFLGNPALRQSGDERSWESNEADREDMIDDFLHGGGLPTTPKRRRKRHDPSVAPTTPKRSESIAEGRDDEGAVVRKVERGGLFGGELVESPVLEATEPLGPFELLRRHSQAEDPTGGLLREASEISVLPPMDMMSELSDYELSDYRLSPPRGLPAVEEQPEAEAEATASEVGFYRDSGFAGSPPHDRSRRHSISTIPLEEDEDKQRDSGVDADWIEAAMAQLKTPEPMNRTPERQPQRRLRRSTLGGQRLRDSASLREAAQDPDRKTIPGTRERVLTGTGTRPETPTGRTSPTKKGYGAIVGIGLAARLASGRTSPMTASTERSDTLPGLRRSVTSPVAAPLRSLRRAVSAQIGPGLQRPESPSLAVLPVVTEQPRSVSDSHIPSATKHQAGEAARADPGRGTPNSGVPRPRTPERLKSSGGSTVRSSSNPSPPLLRRAEKRMSLRQPNIASSDHSGFHSGFDSTSSAPLATRNPNPSTTSIPTISPIPTPSIAGSIADSIAGVLDPSPFPASSLSSPSKPAAAAAKPPSKAASEPPVANEGRARAKDKTDVYDGYGEGRIGSPLSPTRPHSMRRRQSMQVLELEARVEQLMAENRLLSDARHSTDQHLSHRVVTALSDRDTQIESLKQTLKFLRGEVSRLTEVNEGLTSANAELASKDNSRYADLQVTADRGGNQDALIQALHEKDAQIADLTAKLDAAKERIRELQRQILESKAADVQFLNIKDEDYFDHRCQQLCSHVQQWVLRFSKFSDMRACRLTSEINDEKIIDRLDNAVLDGTDVDRYLNDRVRRRDIFMSMTMNMIWEFVFTRYLFGMDREQRQKLKSLEKLLTEVGPPQAVRQWRAVTLTLLSRRDSFKRQRDLDTEAVVQAIYQTLCKVLPPPSNLEAQIQAQLRRVMHEAVHLSIEMRTQKAEYMMLPPLQPEYDADGELVQTVQFNASMMNERSGTLKMTNEELEERGAIVRVVLFPLVVKKGDDDGSNDEEIVICPAQVLIARSKLTRQPTPSTDGGRASTGTGRLSGGETSPDNRPSKAV
ncbi:hypothetical protein CCMA1212_009753 [Trichoderma ghanense]|uniref:Involucrin repeat protein n=1 Tax=Trichoderma ghanense TaxID=65468 RepID=A0ABY2GTC9_9HYPO